MATTVTVYDSSGDIFKKFSPMDFASLDELPKGCTVETLDLCGSDVQRLPRNLSVLNSIDLSHTKSLKEIPDDIRVGGSLNLMRSAVESLPSGLVIGSDLYLGDSKIDHLPDITVKGTLYLINSSLKSISPNVNAYKVALPSDDFLTHPLYCYEAMVNTHEPDLDLSNLKASCVVFTSKGVKYQIRNLITKLLSINGIYTDIEITQSRLDELRLTCGNVVLSPDVDCARLVLGGLTSTANPSTQLDLNGAQVTSLVIDNFIGDLVPIDRLSVSSLVVNRRLNTVLPDIGVVYENAVVRKNTVIPDSFCCLGEIKVQD